MRVRYGLIHIANNEPFSHHPNGFSISPWLQDLLLQLSQSCPFEQAAELARSLLNQSVNNNQLHRLAQHYGQCLDQQPSPLQAMPARKDVLETAESRVVYSQADGSMILTDEGWQEVKLGRVFLASAVVESGVEGRGGRIEDSLYAAHLGHAPDFQQRFSPLLGPYQQPGWTHVFLSDGAIWLRQLMETHHPEVHLILDYYHAMGYVAKAGEAGISHPWARKRWLEEQGKLLLNSQLDRVMTNIKVLSLAEGVRVSVLSYLEKNGDRMDYKAYRAKGWLIGSGAIEAAHRTLVQIRMKLSGQRWSRVGAQRMLSLRVWWESGWWERVRDHIEPRPVHYAMAA